MIATEIQEFIKNVKKVEQGTIEIYCLYQNRYRLVFPDFTEQKVNGKARAAGVARAWFQQHVPDNCIGIGRIDWIS